MPKAEWHDHWNGSLLLLNGEIIAKVRLVDLDFGYKAWEVEGHTFMGLSAAKKFAKDRWVGSMHP